MPKVPTRTPAKASEPKECRYCGRVSCHCCCECGRNLITDGHANKCSLRPRPKACVACEGMGRSSSNHPCVPCGGTGIQGKGKTT